MRTRDPHPESPLRLPLVAYALSDPEVRPCARAIDRGWTYARQIPISIAGFNPARGELYHARHSALASWLEDPARSARPFNYKDRLIGEVLFLVHDYLHCWAYRAIRELAPDLGFGTAPITARNIEDLVFGHLLTEAVATVGLDYWYLSTIDLERVLGIGTLQRGLTVSYREEHLPEFRRFNPRFDVQRPAFYGQIARFYCDGVFVGFDAADLVQSPITLRWLEHELTYGEKQREYSRLWLSYLSDDRVSYPAEKLRMPVATGRRWQRTLVHELGQLLWSMVKDGVRPRFSRAAGIPKREAWRRRAGEPTDFRFANLNEISDGELARLLEHPTARASFDHLAFQYASRYDYKSVAPETVKLLAQVRERKDLALLRHVFRDHEVLPKRRREPADLFLLN